MSLKYRKRNALVGLLLLLPALILIWTFSYRPVLGTIINSFFSTPQGQQRADFVGVEQYATMFADPVFWTSFINNCVYAVTTIPLSIALAFIIALLVNSKIRGRGLSRMAFFTPTVLPMIAIANIWLFFYSPDYGLVDQFLNLFGMGGNNWLGKPETALSALIVITIWKQASFFMIFYLAALQNISPELIEAAKLEGVNLWQQLWRVTIPLLMPTTLFISINAVIGAFRLVDHVIAMTKGGPNNATSLLLFYVYQQAFFYWDTAYAAALTVVLLVILAMIAFFEFGYADRRIYYR